MTETVLIEFLADTSSLAPAIDLLTKTGEIDAKNAASFKKTNDELSKRRVVVDQVTDSTKKQLQTTQNLEKGVNNLGDAFTEAITDEVANTVEKISNRMDVLEKRARASGKSIIDIVKAQEQLKNKLQESTALDPFQKLSKSVSEAEKKVLNLSAQLNTLTSKGISSGPLYDRLSKELPQAQAELNKLRQQYDGVTAAAQRNKVATDDNAEASVSLRTKLRELTLQIATLAAAGDTQSEKYKQLVKEAGNLQDAIGDANEEIRRAGSDTSGLDKTLSAVGAGIGLYSAFAGAAALAGGENEEFQKTMQKLVSVMAILNGLQQFQTELARKDSLIKKGLVAVQTAWTAAITETNVALRITKTALLASGIGALVVLIGVLVTNWDQLTDTVGKWLGVSGEAVEAQKRLNAVHENAADQYIDEATKMDSLISRVKAGGLTFKDKESILKDYNKTFGDSIGKAKDFEDAERKIITLGPDYIKMLQLQAEAQAAFQLAVEESKKALTAGTEEKSFFGKMWQNMKSDFSSLENAFTLNNKKLLDQRAKFANQETQEVITNATKQKDEYLKLQQQRLEEAQALQDKYNFKTYKTPTTKATGPTQIDLLRQAMEEQKALREKELIDIENAQGKEVQAYVDKQNQIADIEKDITLLTVKGVNQRALIIAQSQQKQADNQKQLDLAIAAQRQKDLADDLEAQKKMEEDYVKSKNIDLEIANLRRGAQVLALERQKIGEANKAQVIRINKEISDLQLKSVDDEIALNQELYNKGLKSKEEYERDKLALANKRAQEELNIAREQADAEIKIQEDKAQKEREIRASIMDASLQIVQQTFDAIFQIAKANRDNELQIAIDALNKEKDIAISNKDLTEQQKAALEKKYHDQEAALKTEAAKQDKQNAIAQALINAAVAITKALSSAPPPFNFIAAGLVAAQTAMQVAIIKSTPIPKFERGTQYAPNGLALTGEKGYELVYKDGKYSVVGETGPQFVNLKGGEKIYRHEVSKQMMQEWHINNSLVPATVSKELVSSSSPDEKFSFDYKRLGKEIAGSIPKTGLDVDSEGLRAWVIEGNKKVVFKNKRYRM